MRNRNEKIRRDPGFCFCAWEFARDRFSSIIGRPWRARFVKFHLLMGYCSEDHSTTTALCASDVFFSDSLRCTKVG